jgi:signal transduction histidine kinase/cytochrome c-type biogenesis protein CcmH/NrfG
MSIRYSAFFVFVLLNSIVQAQNMGRIDSLKLAITKTQGEPRARLLNQLGFQFRTSYPDSTIYYCQEALKISQSVENQFIKGESLNFIGIAYSYKAMASEAADAYAQALTIASQGDSLLLAHVHNNLGRLYFESGNLRQAFSNFTKAQRIFEAIENTEGLAYVYRSLSGLYESQRDYANALQMAKRAADLRTRLGDVRGVIAALSQLGKIHQLMGDYLSAEEALRKAETMASDTEDEASLAEVKLGLAGLYLANGSLSKALTEAFRAENIIERLDNPVLEITSNLLLGKLFFEQKDFPEAIRYLNRVAESDSDNQLESVTEASFYLAQVYGLTGQKDKAARYQSLYRTLNDSLKNKELAVMAEKFNLQLDIEKGNRENELLKITEAKNEATILFQRSLITATILVLGLTAVFSFFLWRSATARKMANQKLEIQNHQLIALNDEKDSLMSIVAHDLKTPLTNIASLSDLVPVGNALLEKQDKFLKLIKTSSQAGITLINELLDAHAIESNKQPQLTEIDTVQFLQERCALFQSTAQAKQISLVFQPGSAFSWKTDASWLSRVIDNLISNAVKYSPAATTVNVRSECQKQHWIITVQDQGLGFTEEDKKKVFQKFKKLSARPTGGESSNGLGLSIAKMLIERLGGTISLQSEKNKGSEFKIELPSSIPQ